MNEACTDLDSTQLELRHIAGRINDGLNELLAQIDAIRLANALFLDEEMPNRAGNGATATISKIISAIRLEVTRLAASSRDFEKSLMSCDAGITRMNEELAGIKQRASLDPLTGLASRHKCEALIEGMLAGAGGGDAFAMLLCDVDGFRRINDKRGRSLGDQVLQRVARVLFQSLKGADIIARWGGDEFAVILPETSVENAALVARRIAGTLAAEAMPGQPSPAGLGTIGLAIGVIAHRQGDSLASVAARAAEALSRARRSAGDRVVVGR